MFKERSTLITILIWVFIYIGLIELLLFFERMDPTSNLDTLLEGVWYTTVTIAGVGYGDYVPATVLGKVVGYVFVLGSIGFYGYFVSKLTNYFAEHNHNKKMGFFGTKFEGHTIVLGWDNFARLVVDLLVKVGQKVAIVTSEKNDIDLIYEHYHHNKNIFVLYSEIDNYDLLEKVNIKESKMIFINDDGDAQNLVHLLNMKKHYPNHKYIVPLDNGGLKETFVSAGVHHPVCKHELSSKLLASYIFEPEVAELGEELLTYATNETEHDIKQFQVIDGNRFLRKKYDDVFFDLKKEYNTILLGISKLLDNGEFKLYKNPDEELYIDEGDYLLIICNGKNEHKIIEAFGTEEGIR